MKSFSDHGPGQRQQNQIDIDIEINKIGNIWKKTGIVVAMIAWEWYCGMIES